MMAGTDRRVIVNADDFGQSTGVNAGIIRSFESGILTSASLMVRWPEAVAAAAYGRTHARLSVGLHLDLGEWVYEQGEWRERYAVVPQDDPAAVEREVRRQLERFRDLMGADPTHVDSHQHVHRSPPVDSLLRDIGAALGVPVRHQSPRIRYEGTFYGMGSKGEALPDGISVEGLTTLLRSLPPGVTEIGCHPGVGNDSGGMYVSERAIEVATLCSPRIRAVLESEAIALVSFHDAQLGFSG